MAIIVKKEKQAQLVKTVSISKTDLSHLPVKTTDNNSISQSRVSLPIIISIIVFLIIAMTFLLIK